MRAVVLLLACSFLLPAVAAHGSYGYKGSGTVTCGAKAANVGVLCGAAWCVPAAREDGTYRFVLKWTPTAPSYATIRLNVTTLDASGAQNGPNVVVSGASPLVVELASRASDERVCPAFAPADLAAADPALEEQPFTYAIGLR